MRRREFITLLGGAVVARPLAARAQQSERPRRVGVLMNLAADDPEVVCARMTAFVQRLQQLGWTDGRNLRIDARWGAGDADRYRTHAAELIALAPDVIVTATSGGDRRGAKVDPHGTDRVRAGGRPGWRRFR